MRTVTLVLKRLSRGWEGSSGHTSRAQGEGSMQEGMNMARRDKDTVVFGNPSKFAHSSARGEPGCQEMGAAERLSKDRDASTWDSGGTMCSGEITDDTNYSQNTQLSSFSSVESCPKNLFLANLNCILSLTSPNTLSPHRL